MFFTLFTLSKRLFYNCPDYRRKLLGLLQRVIHAVLLCKFLNILLSDKHFSTSIFLLIAGDIETNPGPASHALLKFCHRNLNSICARGSVKIPLIEAYNSLHQYDIMALSETMLDNSISSEDIYIESFSREVYRNDHPSNAKVGSVCIYFRDGLAIKQRRDLEMMQETMVSEVNIARKKIFFITVYRSPSKNSEQVENFISNMQIMINRLQMERPHSVVLTEDFNCRTSQWWTEDVESPEGMALDETTCISL